MTNKKPEAPRSNCPINIALEIFGDRWSLLIIRDLMFKGKKSFREFRESAEGVATNILTDRLRTLQQKGLIEKRRDAGDARKINYRLTDKGFDLAPALIEIILWAARYEKTAAPESMIRKMSRDTEKFIQQMKSARE